MIQKLKYSGNLNPDLNKERPEKLDVMGKMITNLHKKWKSR